VVLSLQVLWNEDMVFSGIAQGNWETVYLPAMASLMCGFFWEMWNFHSAAKWIYPIPFVQRFQIFEMPILGYAGYVPFGWECMVAAGLSSQFCIGGRGFPGWLFGITSFLQPNLDGKR